tara:strand:- start:558 stop:674 length:117 start_codon:yes stop_codon:yes gene_type:complete
MIKKIILISILFSLLISCGKKTDLEYKANQKVQLTNNI